jgi:hypothetical protein
MKNDTVGKTGDLIATLCCLCLRPIAAGQQMHYMGQPGLRNVWAHRSCWDARYHGAVHGKQEPQEKQAGLWEVSE